MDNTEEIDSKEELIKRIANRGLREYFNLTGNLVTDKISCGMFGCVYNTTVRKDIVVKVTKDKSEAIVISNKLLNKDNKYIVKYYYVAKITLGDQATYIQGIENPMYCIIMEKVLTNSDISKDVYQTSCLSLRVKSIIKEKDLKKKRSKLTELLNFSLKYFKTVKTKSGIIKYITSYHKAKAELDQLNIKHIDFHQRNVGLKNGNFILFDIMEEYSKDNNNLSCPNFTL